MKNTVWLVMIIYEIVVLIVGLAGFKVEKFIRRDKLAPISER